MVETLAEVGTEAIRSGSVFGLGFAFVFGLVSFLSPCVLPMAPPYLAYLGGTTIEQISGDGAAIDRAAARRVMLAALFFVLGLGTVFVALGIGMASAGGFLLENKSGFAMASGVLVYVFGLHFWGLRQALPATLGALTACGIWWLATYQPFAENLAFAWPGLGAVLLVGIALQATGWQHIPVLHREARFEGPATAGSVGASFLIGMAFAFGWTPCLGPILAAILTFAAQSGSMLAGGILLGVYALGLGVPFLLAALFIRPFLRWMRRFRRHLARVEKAMGALLMLVGLMMVTGEFERMAWFLIETFPALAALG
jgi:cytochrome c-type biogenesis protein